MIRTSHTPAVRRIIGATIAATLAAGLTGCGMIGSLTGQGDDVFSIKVGDCFNEHDVDVEAEMVSSVKFVDCAQPHDYEATKSIIVADGIFPGDSVISDRGSDECAAAFEEYSGFPDDDSSDYYSTFYSPTTESWDDGDREILCLISAFDGQSSGSAKDAGR